MRDTVYNGTGYTVSGQLWNVFAWQRPSSYWTVAGFHAPWAMIFGGAILLPYLVVTPHQLPLLPCTFLFLTGYPCPLCGFTRAFWDIADGQWAVAMANCPLAFLVYAFVAAVAAWHLSALVSGVVLSRGPGLKLGKTHRRKAVGLVMVLFALNWGYRLSMGLQ